METGGSRIVDDDALAAGDSEGFEGVGEIMTNSKLNWRMVTLEEQKYTHQAEAGE